MGSSLFQILHVSRQDMLSRMSQLDVLANNLANVNTSGYKSTRANFQELLTASQRSGDHLSSTQLITTQGALDATENPLDLAISGEGFFAVSLPGDQVAYTRDGHFSLDADNQIVTASGNPLVWDGEIPAGAVEVQIQPNGLVQARVGETWTDAGSIELSHFTNPTALQAYGSNLWLETPTSGTATTAAPGSTGVGEIVPSALELSNVNLSLEMTNMVTLQRSFQMALNTFKQTDDMISQAIHMRKV